MQQIGKIKEEINFEKIYKKIRTDGRKEVHLEELPYQVRLNNPHAGSPRPRAAVTVKGIRHHQPSHGPRRPALELTEQKRRTRVVTLRVRDRDGLRKVGHTAMALAQYPPSAVPLA